MINIDTKVLAMLQASTCFGYAFDVTVPECKQCDVKNQCQAKTEGINIETPTVKMMDEALAPVRKEQENKQARVKSAQKAMATKKTNAKAKKKVVEETKKVSGNMPEFKGMSLDALKELADKNGVTWSDYGNDNITRMRLIMSLKKCYQ